MWLDDKLDFEDEGKLKEIPISFGKWCVVVLFNKTWETNEGAGVECVCMWNRVVMRHCQHPSRAIPLGICYVSLEFR